MKNDGLTWTQTFGLDTHRHRHSFHSKHEKLGMVTVDTQTPIETRVRMYIHLIQIIWATHTETDKFINQRHAHAHHRERQR